MKKILLIAGAAILLIVLVISGITGYATGTKKGLTKVLSLAQKYAPGDLQWDSVTGKLLGPLDIRKLNYQQDDGVSISMASAAFDWEPKQLFSKRLKINRLNATDIIIHLPPAKEKEAEQPFSLPDIHLPVALDIRELDLKNIQIYPHNVDKPIVIERLNLTAAAEGATVQVLNFKLKSPEADASITGTLQPSDNYPMDIQLSWEYRHAEYGAFNGSGEIKGDLKTLRLDHQIEGAANTVVKAELFDLVEEPSWDADINLHAKNPRIFSDQLNPDPLIAVFHSSGKPDAFNAKGNIETSLSATGATQLDFNLQGNTEKILLENLLVKLVDRPGEIELQGDIVLATLEANFHGDWKQLGWPMTEKSEYNSEHGKFSFVGSPKNYSVQLSTALNGTQLLPLTASIDVAGTDQIIQIKTFSLSAADNDLNLNASGNFNIEDQSFNLDGQWQSVVWPMQGEAQVASPKGKFQAKGKLTDYEFEVQTDLLGENIPKGSWHISGHGSDQALAQFQLNGKVLEGNIQSNGTAAWTPQVTWDIALAGGDINPGAHWPEAKGNINLQITSKGQLTEDGPQLNARIAKLSGKFRDQPIRGQGQVQVKGKHLKFDQLQIVNGDAQLTLDGQLGEQWDVKWDIDSKDLSQVVPDFKGSVSAKGSLQGSKELPHAKFDLLIKNLAGAGIKIKQLQGDGTIDISGSKSSSIKLTGKNLFLGGENWQTFSADGSGLPENHNLQITLNGPLAKIRTALKGGVKDQTWRGVLSELAAEKTAFGDWRLDQAVAIEANQSAAKTDTLCLSSKPTQVCINGSWDANAGSKGEIKVKELKPDRFEKYLPPGIQLLTALNGTIIGAVDGKGGIDANADLSFTPGKLKIEGNGEPTIIDLRKGKLSAKILENDINSSMVMDFGETGEIKLATVISDFKKAQKLSGDFKANLKDLSAISGFAPDLQAVEGLLDANLTLSGTLKTPLISGELKVHKFATEIPQLATKITVPEIKISSDGQGPIRLEGTAESGEGKLSLRGEFDPSSKALKLKLKGESFEVAKSKALKAIISPDLTIEMDNEGMFVKGVVLIPTAHIDAKGAGGEAGVVSVSGDVVVVENGEVTTSKSAASNINLDVKILLGDDIKVKVADFSGELRGSLRVQQTPELAPLGTGMIEVVNGDYLVYGQQLKMERGRVLFGGGPVDNPQLDMNVARRVEAYDVTAGAYILGTAQAPQLELYSEPSMPDASILSYMILGQPPGTKGGSYTLGKYLTPDLYVGYSIGLFNAINTFNLRYKLTEKLGLHAASGVANSADLIYTIER